jgi:acetyl-CoA carboxylase biotin carboxyl carrier protein
MRKLNLVILAFVSVLTSCTSVDPGHKGLKVEWGGKTDVTTIYPEGMHSGFGWIVDDMIQYDVRERTTVERMEFNDKNNMKTGVEVAVDYNPDPFQLGLLHTKVTDFQTKVSKTIKSAAKEVIPQYTASELNLTKRTEAEQKLSEILAKELPEFFMVFARVQLTDVDIPEAIATAAEQTAKQKAEVEPIASNLHEIRSPIVGTFYRAPAPDADSYIQIGSAVSPGSVVCIVEAMKLMNEIESDVAGKVVKILVESGKPVEYNQPLFLIELT